MEPGTTPETSARSNQFPVICSKEGGGGRVAVSDREGVNTDGKISSHRLQARPARSADQTRTGLKTQIRPTGSHCQPPEKANTLIWL